MLLLTCLKLLVFVHVIFNKIKKASNSFDCDINVTLIGSW